MSIKLCISDYHDEPDNYNNSNCHDEPDKYDEPPCESEIINCIHPCLACGFYLCNNPACRVLLSETTQRKILNQVRVASSQLLNIKGAVTIGNEYINNDLDTISFPGQNMSDRLRPHIQTRYVPRIRTRNRPGQMGPDGVGVDVKHGSYARYLGKLKAPIVTSVVTKEPAIRGNKTTNFSLLNTTNIRNYCKCYDTPAIPVASPPPVAETVAPSTTDSSAKCQQVLKYCPKYNRSYHKPNYYQYQQSYNHYNPGKSL